MSSEVEMTKGWGKALGRLLLQWESVSLDNLCVAGAGASASYTHHQIDGTYDTFVFHFLGHFITHVDGFAIIALVELLVAKSCFEGLIHLLTYHFAV